MQWPIRETGSRPGTLLAEVACPSGLRSTPRKRVWVKVHRGFKSHRYRQSKGPTRMIMRKWGPSSFPGHQKLALFAKERAPRGAQHDDRAVRAEEATVTIERADTTAVIGILANIAAH